MGITLLDLFRSGNASSAGLDRVRIIGQDPDVTTYVDPATGATFVQADGKGVSTWDAPGTSWTGKTWVLPKGSSYPDTLIVWNDDPNHWTWAAAADMSFADYQAALATANALFVKI